MSRSSEVIIAGAGVVGLSVAVHLRWLGVPAIVLDQDRIGSGTSTRGFGTISALHRRPASYLRLMLAALSHYPEFVDRLGCPAVFRRSGAISLFRTEAELAQHRAVVEEQRAVADYDPGELLDFAALRRIEPALHPGFLAGAYRSEDAQIEPDGLVAGLHAGARREGAVIVQGARVDAVDFVRGAWQVSTPVGEFSAPTLVNCAGVWSERLGRLSGLTIPVRSVRGQIIVLEAGEQHLSAPLSWAGQLDVRQARDGRYWLGTVEQVDSWDLQVRASDTELILERVEEALVGIADQPVSEAWAGLRPVPADGLPLLGQLAGAESYYVAVGHGGLSFCGVEGRGLAAQIAGGPVDPLLAPFDPNRPMPGWQPPEASLADGQPGLLTSATRHGMRLDATDWSRVALVASRTGEAARRLADAADGQPLRTTGPART